MFPHPNHLLARPQDDQAEYCRDCALPIANREEWAYHLISSIHQDNVLQGLHGWIQHQPEYCLLILISSSSVRYSILEITTKLLACGFMKNLCMDVLEDEKLIVLVRYDTAKIAWFASSTLGQEEAWNVRILKEVGISEWNSLVPKRKLDDTDTDTDTENKNESGTDESDSAPPPAKLVRLADSDTGKKSSSSSSSEESSNCPRPCLPEINEFVLEPEPENEVLLMPADPNHDNDNDLKPIHHISPIPSPTVPMINGERETSSAECHMAALDAQFEQFYKSHAFDPEDIARMREILVTDLKLILRQRFPNCELHLLDTITVGKDNAVEINATETGVYDLDGPLPAPKCFLSEKKLRHYKEARQNDRMIVIIGSLLKTSSSMAGQGLGNIRYIANGFLSSVRFTYAPLPTHKFFLTCCVSRAQRTRRQDLKLIEFYMMLNPAVRAVLCIVQHWARRLDFIGFHKIKDYLLSIMVLVVLAKARIIPSLEILQLYCSSFVDVQAPDWLLTFVDNEELSRSVAVLIQAKFVPAEIPILALARAFFLMYGNRKLARQVVCTWTGHVLPVSVFRKEPGRLPKMLAEYRRLIVRNGCAKASGFRIVQPFSIQDPFELTFNLGSTVHAATFEEFQAACIETVIKLDRLLSPRPDNSKLDLMSIFDPLDPNPRQKSFIPYVNPNPSLSDIDIASIPSTMVAQFQAQLRSFKVITPIHDACTKYCLFMISKEFRSSLRSHMNRESEFDAGISRPELFRGMCKLWSTFTIHFIRSVWSDCFDMDTRERILLAELVEDKGGPESDVFRVGHPTLDAFPIGYSKYYGYIDCRGFLGQEPKTRWKLRAESDLKSAAGSHPYEVEAEITKYSEVSTAINRKNGDVTWAFQVEVLYDNDDGNAAQNPKVLFILNGADNAVLQYAGSTLKAVFHAYQMYLLKLWFDHKEELAREVSSGVGPGPEVPGSSSSPLPSSSQSQSQIN